MATHIGIFKATTLVHGNEISIDIFDVLYAQDFSCKLLSLRALQERGLDILFVEDQKLSKIMTWRLMWLWELLLMDCMK